MNKIQAALADVRRWLCSHLNDRDAGKICGMLSIVSNESSALEIENVKLRQENERIRKAQDDWIKLPVDGEAPSQRLADWLERRGLVTGPLDANGELWHSGDMSDSEWGVIEGICFDNGVWFIGGHDISAPWIRADSIAHYHPDTWESIIEDAVKLGFTDPDNEHLAGKLVARCKALAGDAECELRKYAKLMHDHINECCNACGERCICNIDALTRELGIEVPDA